MSLIYTFSSKSFIINKKDSNNYFIQYGASFSAPIESEYNIDIVYFYDKTGRNILNEDNINKISFKDSKLTNIKDFKIVKSDSSKKYNIGTLSLSIEFLKEGKENINFLEFVLRNGKKVIYPIGSWNINTYESKIDENYLLMGSGHPIMTKYFNKEYLISLENNYTKPIKITDIDITLPNYNTLNKEFPTIGLKEKFKDTLYFDFEAKENKKNGYNFFIVRPKIDYLIDKDKHSFYSDISYFGYLNITDETIEKEVIKSKK